MAYFCRDCSYSTQGKISRGRCPACGSLNIQESTSTTQKPLSAKKKKTLVEYVILAVFWGFLLWGIWDRYLK